MSHRKLLKAPARVLLLTFVVSAGITVAVSATPPSTAPRTSHGQRAMTSVKSRARSGMDFSHVEGVQRWGLNE